MSKIKLTSMLCALILFSKSQPWTGMTSHSYPASNVYVSAGKPALLPSNSNNGFILAGYASQLISGNNFNLFIDKTNDAGLIAGISAFQKRYALSTGGMQPQCFAPLNLEVNCHGVSLIETFVTPPAVPTTVWYAITTAFDSGVLFAGIRPNGGVSTSAFYQFPAGTTHPNKPVITESVFHPRTYYICGDYIVGGI